MIPVEPARSQDIGYLRDKIVVAIDESPYYGDRFKTHEKKRFNRDFLRQLISIDPWHVAVARDGGDIAGFVITIPEYGNLWSPWIYASARARAKALGLSMTRFMIRHWDNGRFHKASCYVRPDNRTARLVFARVGFSEIAYLRNHIFGEDFILLERPFTKALDGYDDGMQITLPQRLHLRMGRLRDRISDR